MKLIRTEGIVIRKTDHSESDRSIVLFTKNLGRISVNVKGIRKSKKRHLSGADLLGVSTFILYKKDEYYTLSSFELIKSFDSIKEDLEKSNLAFHILSILNSILVENETQSSLYKLLINALSFMDKSSSKVKNLLLLSYFITNIIHGEGLIFQLSNGLYLDIETSRFVETKTPFKFSNFEKTILILLLDRKIHEIMKLSPNIEDIKNIINLLETYINYHLNTKIRFVNFF